MSSGPADGAAARDLEQLIAEFHASGLRELHVRREGFELYLSNDAEAAGLQVSGPVPTQASASPAPTASSAAAMPAAPNSAKPAPAPVDLPEGAAIVRAPYLGSFYRSPKPGSPPFVEQGQTVTAETELCLVEVMKLFTAVRAGVAGVVHAVLASDGEMVAADQPLFVVVPG